MFYIVIEVVPDPITMISTKTTAMINVVIADDHFIFRNGLINLLKEKSSINVVGQASNGKELIELTDELRPNVVITDINMPGIDGFEATEVITNRFPEINVLALSMCDKELSILKMLKAGAKGYLLKTSEQEELFNAIDAVGSSDYCYFTSVHSAILNSIKTKETTNQVEFTDKELEVIQFICKEYSNKEIALKIGCTTRSVESARERIQNKTGAKNMVGIVLYAIKNKIFRID